MIETRNFLFLFYGLAAAWLLLGGYVVYLVRRESRIQKSLENLRSLVKHSER
jgi:CcmD family protein